MGSIWFDRKARGVHAYGFTRERSQPISALVEFLERQLASLHRDDADKRAVSGS